MKICLKKSLRSKSLKYTEVFPSLPSWAVLKALLRERTGDRDQCFPSAKATLEAALLCKPTEVQETVLRSKENL